MRTVAVSCIAVAVADDSFQVPPANRSLLNERRLATGRRLGDAKCEVEVYPFAYGKKAPYAAGNEAAECTSALPAVLVDGANAATAAANNAAACCFAAPLCSTTYQDNGGTAAGKTACSTTGAKVPAALSCFTVTTTASVACGTATATHSSALDAAHCCRQDCNDATGGFELTASDANKPECPTAGSFQVHATAYCASDDCGAGDQATCCQKKCSSGFVLSGVTLDATVGNDANCPTASATVFGADRVSTTAYCSGSSCTSDTTTCCEYKCANIYELHGGTSTMKRQCAEGLRVSPDAYVTAWDDATCCETKCDAAGAGFELNGGSTSGMSQCAKDLRVHPTEYCDGTSCSASSGVCCQQKCTAGFKLNGATTSESQTCGKDLTVHATAYCKGSSCAASDAGTCCQQKCSKGWKLDGATTKESNTCPKDTTLATDGKCVGSPCAASDDKLCCNEKCTHKTTGFKVHKGTGKEPNECKKGEIVSSKAMCKGDCSSDDASTCCLKANNSTATTDANSAGLAAVVGMLIVLSAAS